MTRRVSAAEAEQSEERICPHCEGEGTEPRRGKSGTVFETQCRVCKGRGEV